LDEADIEGDSIGDETEPINHIRVFNAMEEEKEVELSDETPCKPMGLTSKMPQLNISSPSKKLLFKDKKK
jgi:hypothetical protein